MLVFAQPDSSLVGGTDVFFRQQKDDANDSRIIRVVLFRYSR